MALRFPHLHLHSHYSLLSALPKIGELVNAGIRSGATALALTDFDNLYGAIEFYKECKENGIKPIIGLNANVGDPSAGLGASGPSMGLGTGERLVLLAENEAGYRNLLGLVTKAQLASDGKPVFTEAMLAEHTEGLIALAPKGRGARFKKLFGEKHFFDDAAVHESYYLKPSDRRAWEVMRAIARGEAQDGGLQDEEDYSLWSEKQMRAAWSAEELARAQEIADRCTLELTLGSWVFPKLSLPPGTTYEAALCELVREGLERRNMEETPEVKARIEYEYKIICDKGFAPYFSPSPTSFPSPARRAFSPPPAARPAAPSFPISWASPPSTPSSISSHSSASSTPSAPKRRISTWTSPTTGARR